MKNHSSQTLAVIALFVAAMASRIYTPFAGAHNAWLENFSPIAAICLCGAMYFPRKSPCCSRSPSFFFSDIFLDMH